MKRCVSIIFILCIMLFPLCAVSKLLIPNSLVIGMGNDKWDIGLLSYNADDQLTFSEHVRLSAPLWSLNLNMMAISNRGWQDGWLPENEHAIGDGIKFDGRYDVTEISLTLFMNIVNNDSFFLNLKPEAGISIVGNQGYEKIQNNFHKLLQIATVEIPYEATGNEIKLQLSSQLDGGIRIPLKSFLGFGAKIQYIPTFSSITMVYLSIGNLENFKLSLSYSFVTAKSQWKTQEVYYEHLKGPALELSIDSGFMKLSFHSNLLTNNGYGIVSFDVLSLFEEAYWKNSDIYLTFKEFKQINSYFYEIMFSYPIDKASISLSIRYLSDNQSFVSIEQKQDTNYKERYRKSFPSIFVGYDYSFGNTNLILTPYINLKGGIMLWQVIIQRNMLVNNNIQKEVYPMIYSLALDLELGLKLFNQYAVRTKNTEAKLIIFAGLTLIHNPSEVKAYLEDLTDNSERINYLLPRIGFGVEIGFDL